MVFEVKLTIFRFLLPILCSGMLLTGIVFFSYLYYRSRIKIYRAMIIGFIFALIFTSGEAMVLVAGGWLHDDQLGMQFHRLSQIGGAFFIFAVPLLLGHLITLSNLWSKINRIVTWVALFIAVLITLIAFIEPDLFISLTTHEKTWLINEGDYGRGLSGIVYFLRDMILGLLGLYFIIIVVIDLRKKHNSRFLFPPLIGILLVAFFAADDIINIHTGIHIGFFPNIDYSRFTLGITLFTLITMGGLIRNFIDIVKETEESKNIALLEITERKKAENEREKFREQLYQSQKFEAVGLLASGIAHDFNNILTVVTGNASMIKAVVMDEGFQENRVACGEEINNLNDEIISASGQAVSLTKQLLTFSREESFNPISVNLNEIVKKLEKILKRIIGKDFKISFSFSKEKIMILADKVYVEQILMNLITNARDALSGGGSISVVTNIEDIDDNYPDRQFFGKSGRYGCLSVQDYGAGMSEEIQKKIFEPFFTTKESGKGTGLGLSTVFGIVKQHGGAITIKSSIGTGSEFKVYFPIRE